MVARGACLLDAEGQAVSRSPVAAPWCIGRHQANGGSAVNEDRRSAPIELSKWREVVYVDRDDEMIARHLAEPMHVRLGWLRDWLHRLSHRKHCPRWVHNWLVRSRFYAWWGRQRYGPSFLDVQAKQIADAIDRDLAALYASDTPSIFGPDPLDTMAKLDEGVRTMRATPGQIPAREEAVLDAIDRDERQRAAVARIRDNIRSVTDRPVDPFRAFRQLARRFPRNGL